MELVGCAACARELRRPTLANLFLTLDLSDFDRMHAAHLAASETHHRPAA
ncbi:MAG: hypothetical protein AAFR38_07380 [Planctomycetota bacterium]